VQGQMLGYDLKNISDIVRTQPDSAILLLPVHFQNKDDSIKAAAYLLMGNAWYYKSGYDSAIVYFSRATDFFLALRDEMNLPKAYNGIGLGYYFLSDYERSFEFHKKAMEIRLRTNDPQITSTYNNMGLVLTELGSTQEALRYYKKAFEAKIRFKQFGTLSTTLTNIGNNFKKRNQLDSAIYYELENLKHLDSIPDDRNLATCYNNLSHAYLIKADFKNAEPYALKALQLEKKLKRGFEITTVGYNLSRIYLGLDRINFADKYLDSVFILVKNASDFRTVPDIYLMQAQIDSLKGNAAAAYVHLGKYVDLKRHFDEVERKDLVLDLEKKYEGEIKQQQILELQQANTIKDLEAASARQRQIFLIIGLGLLIVSVLVLYNRYQLKQRTAKVLDEKNSELQKLNGFKDRMFAVISHDLRNPVDAFSTIIESLNQNLQHASKEELKEFLESTLDSAKDLKSLLNNLLEWSLVQIGKLPFDPKPAPLKSIVEDSVGHLESMASLKKINIISSIDGELVLGDREMITIIIRNLVSNAVKFSKNESVVELKSVVKEGSVVLTIKDEGLGMKPEELSKLFKQEENVRTIGSSSAKGAGIGLLLCKELTDKNGGKIYAESEPGNGSTFYLELPTA